ncbi:hypothetical protein NC653_004537 [Populus alba x Populus x berolinensis]|uniref:Uncharacterized protein n=1 Tax=Populus alba x Populus x berolinensis TaxID=444605 RepID=A0AAD6WJV8_9ROSI|nr:hypothetical protein NC653_004537 [Populus alba x Populus x berolinensis]
MTLRSDCLVYRSYIALGSYQLVINEIDDSAATPLQAVKLLLALLIYFFVYWGMRSLLICWILVKEKILFLVLVFRKLQESTISSLKEWLADSAIANNSILRLIAGIMLLHGEDYSEALKHTNAGGTVEL